MTTLVVIAAAAGAVSSLALVDRYLEAARLRRAKILFFIAREGGETGWVRSFDIRDHFDSMAVYPVLHRLAARGVLERREGPTTMAQLNVRGRSAVWYRIKRDRP